MDLKDKIMDKLNIKHEPSISTTDYCLALLNADSDLADSGKDTPPTAPCKLSSAWTRLLSPTDSPSTSPRNTLTCTPSITSPPDPLAAPRMSSSFPSSLLVTYNSIVSTPSQRQTAHIFCCSQPLCDASKNN